MLVYPRRIDFFLKNFMEADYEGWNARVDDYLLNATLDEKEFILKFMDELYDTTNKHQANYHHMEKHLEKYSSLYDGFLNSYLFNSLKSTDYTKLEISKRFNECLLVLGDCYNKFNERE